MAERHPDELDLLDLVEDELPPEGRRIVSAHVETCAACRETVRELQTGRAALRTSALLQLPERRRDAISAAVDREAPIRRGTLGLGSPRRLGAIALAALLVAASAVAVVQWGGVGLGGDDAAEEVAAEGRDVADAAEEEPFAEEGAPAEPEALSGEVGRVAGPAREVAAELRARGFDARAENREVVVRTDGDARAADALSAYLEERGPGRVRVRVESP